LSDQQIRKLDSASEVTLPYPYDFIQKASR